MKPLEYPERHYLNAAVGWLELGNATEAFTTNRHSKESPMDEPAMPNHAVLIGWTRRPVHDRLTEFVLWR